MTMHLRCRSKLFTPGTHAHMFAGAAASPADLVVLDLEDSVPADGKHSARSAVAAALRGDDFAGRRCGVRINEAASHLWLDDLLAVACRNLDEIHLPKVTSARQLATVADALATLSASREDLAITIVPTIESAAGVRNLDEIAQATDLLGGIQLGLADLTLDVGFEPDETRLAWFRAEVVVAAAAAGVPAFDPVHLDHRDLEGFEKSAREARAWGMAGKSCIHPDQVPIANAVFRPSPEEVARARQITAAFQAAQHRGVGVTELDGQMIDRPVAEAARRLLELE